MSVREFDTELTAVAEPLAETAAAMTYQTTARTSTVTARVRRPGRIFLKESMPVSAVSIAP